jgi:hypothetical protein
VREVFPQLFFIRPIHLDLENKIHQKEKIVLFYQLMLRMCIYEHSLAHFWMASRLNEKKCLIYLFVLTKGTVVVVPVPVFGLASTVKFTGGFLA